MAKDTTFTVYNLQRKNPQKLASPPVKIRQSQLDQREWTAATKSTASGGSKVRKARGRASKKRPAAKLPKRAMDVLRVVSNRSEWACEHCNNYGDDANCSGKCYTEFKKQFIGNEVDIRGPGRLGYAAYTKPGVTITKGQYLGEYIGDLRPLDSEEALESLYCFTIPDRCIVDARRAGNWTRFMNSSCRPNVKTSAAYVGGTHVILFQAAKDIGPEEELTFNYGKNYFKNAGFDCSCDAQKEPHKPSQRRDSR